MITSAWHQEGHLSGCAEIFYSRLAQFHVECGHYNVIVPVCAYMFAGLEYFMYDDSASDHPSQPIEYAQS